jgi:hypothetical protein
MGSDVLHSQGYHITIKDLDLNYFTNTSMGCKKHLRSLQESKQKIKTHIVSLTYYNGKFMMKFGS